MSGLRETIRRVPFATEIFELTTGKAKMVSSRKQVKAILASGQEIKLDLGGGYQPGRNGWINIDISPQADLFWNLQYGIPFPDASVDRVYSSHLFEHLTYEQGQLLLDECMRVLKPGAPFSIVVPNARIYIEAYLAGVELPDEYLGWRPAYNNTTGIDAVNYIAYMAGEHTYMFDLPNLLHILNAKGFERVTERAFDPATDLIERDYESIYAIGYKPAT
jgi:predicted SAM-dependent methyltransferase